ncbi:hypothetical protein EIP91_012187 [Steccherinum ochraceum]|uniref:Poly(A) RNA polymerase mitochondrial-like central palm domain-containing protein n=1 Tax=Steccherinum ochraceum TaxID=92696 RepID=A0A4R0RKG6_9APHY|nr:hypothetical protein EIP91_012187 [Steccherinum ochraceum]
MMWTQYCKIAHEGHRDKELQELLSRDALRKELLIQNVGEWLTTELGCGLPNEIHVSSLNVTMESLDNHQRSIGRLFDSTVISTKAGPFSIEHDLTPKNLKRFEADSSKEDVMKAALMHRLKQKDSHPAPWVPLPLSEGISGSVVVSLDSTKFLDKFLQKELAQDPRAKFLSAVVLLWAQSSTLRRYPSSWWVLLVLAFLKRASPGYDFGQLPSESLFSSIVPTCLGRWEVVGMWPRRLSAGFIDFLVFCNDVTQLRATLHKLPNKHGLDKPAKRLELHGYLARLAASLTDSLCKDIAAQASHTIRALESGCPRVGVLSLFSSQDGKLMRWVILADPDAGLMHFYESKRPSPQVILNRLKVVDRLSRAIRDSFGFQYTLEAFGSTAYGLDTSKSDMDLTIIDPALSIGLVPGIRNSPDISSIKHITIALRRSGFQALPIQNATVPIVKYVDVRTGIHGDINFNNRAGNAGAALISRYIDLLPLLRPLLTYIKEWAASVLHQNEMPRTNVTPLTNYALTLMTIGMFQAKGYLPSLQADLEGSPRDVAGEVFWFNPRPTRHIKCDIRFNRMEGWQSGRPPLSIGQALVMWFQFWGKEFDYKRQLVNVKDGGVFQREVPCYQDFRLTRCYNYPHLIQQDRLTAAHAKQQAWAEWDHLDYIDLTRPLETQPTRWSDEVLVVPDPWVSIRNAAGNVTGNILGEFVNECENAFEMLRVGMSLQQLTPSLMIPTRSGQSKIMDAPPRQFANLPRTIMMGKSKGKKAAKEVVDTDGGMPEAMSRHPEPTTA